MPENGTTTDRSEGTAPQLRPLEVVVIQPLDASEVTETLERPALDLDAIPPTRPSFQSAPPMVAAEVAGDEMLLEIESIADPPRSGPTASYSRPPFPSVPPSSRASRSSIPPPLPPAAMRASRSSMPPPLPPSSRASRSSIAPAVGPLPPLSARPQTPFSPSAAAPLSLRSSPPPPPTFPVTQRSGFGSLQSPSVLPPPPAPPARAANAAAPLMSTAPTTAPLAEAPLETSTAFAPAPVVVSAPASDVVSAPASDVVSVPAPNVPSAPAFRPAIARAFGLNETPSVSPVAMSVSLGHRAWAAAGSAYAGPARRGPSRVVLAGALAMLAAAALAAVIVAAVSVASTRAGRAPAPASSLVEGVTAHPTTTAHSTDGEPRAPLPPVAAAPPSLAVPAAPATPGKDVSTATLPAVAVENLPTRSGVPADTTLVTFPASAKGHRVFVDGRVVGTGAVRVPIKCGVHKVQIGSAGKARVSNLPCGGEVTLD